MKLSGYIHTYLIPRFKMILIIFAVVAAGFLYNLIYQYVYRMYSEPRTRLKATNTGPVLYSRDQLFSKLKRYPEVFTTERLQTLYREKEFGSYIIPGLKATKTLEGKTISMCTSMTPQGLAVSDRYLFISAYCHTHRHRSVIYVIDKESHEFVKEIVLPDKSHVGGLAYDTIHDNLWVSGMIGGTAYANAYSLTVLEKYSLEEQQEPLSYTQSVPLHTLPRNSFMTYDNNQIYAGSFTLKEQSQVQMFDLKEDGTFAQEYNSRIAEEFGLGPEKQPFAIPHSMMTIGAQVQGIAHFRYRFGRYAALSQSYGLSKSKLRIFSDTALIDGNYILMDENAVATYILPDKLEQICIADGKIYMLFESAAYAYRARGESVDRVLSIPLDASP